MEKKYEIGKITPATKILLNAAQHQIDEQKLIVSELRSRISDLGRENMENKSARTQAEILLESARREISDYERTLIRERAEKKALQMELEQLREILTDAEDMIESQRSQIKNI